MIIVELERHADRVAAGAVSLAHYSRVVISRSLPRDQAAGPLFTVYLAGDRTGDPVEGVTQSRYMITQTHRLGFAALVARGCASADSELPQTHASNGPDPCTDCGRADNGPLDDARRCEGCALQHREGWHASR